MDASGMAFLSLVIPTRNEADNVEALIAGICEALPGSSKELIFVDDSDDGTAEVLHSVLADADFGWRVEHRAPEARGGGLSTAVVYGFSLARGTFICVMDADLQHPAAAIPMLAEAASSSDADVVVGSRYMKSQESPLDGFDGASRRFVSSSARLVAHTMSSARATTDPLSGFFLVRRSVLEGVSLRPIGYKVLLEILVRGDWRKVVDVPYVFHSRNAGVSKATMRQGLQFVRHMSLLAISREPGRRRARQAAERKRSEAVPAHLLREQVADDLAEPLGDTTGAVHAER